MYYQPAFFPLLKFSIGTVKDQGNDTPRKRWGILGRVNICTKFDEVSDGLSNTIMTRELQHITSISPGSKDGWAIGGPATLFTTGAMVKFDGAKCINVASPADGLLSNNRFWGSPGSEMSWRELGMADGRVVFLSTSMDPNIFALLGSMADGVAFIGPGEIRRCHATPSFTSFWACHTAGFVGTRDRRVFTAG